MANIYLIKSDSFNLLNIKLDEILNNKYDITRFSLLDTEIYDILDDASYFGFTDLPRAIIISNTKFFGKKFLYEDESNAIINFARNNKDTVLIFLCDEITKTKNNVKELVKLGAEVIDLSIGKDTDVYQLVNNYTEHIGVKIDKKSIDILLKNTSNNLDMVLSEIFKFSCITNNITEDVINTYGFKLPEDDVFKFSSAVIAKNFDLAFKLLDEFINNGMEVFSLVGVLSNSFSNMYIVKDALANHLSDEEIASIFGYTTGRLYYLKKDANIYTLDNLKQIIVSISDLDLKIKTGYDPVYTIKEFLLNL